MAKYEIKPPDWGGHNQTTIAPPHWDLYANSYSDKKSGDYGDPNVSGIFTVNAAIRP